MISAEAKDAFLSSLTGRYSPRSVANVRASLNQLFRFLPESGYEVPQDLLPRLTEREEEFLREFSDYLTLEGKAIRAPSGLGLYKGPYIL